jgi:hypothetical protein
MYWRPASLATVFVIAVGLTMGVDHASACSCAPTLPPLARDPNSPAAPSPTPPAPDPLQQSARAEIDSADAALVGRLLRVRRVRSKRRYEIRADFSYRIEAVYKGKRRLRRGRIVTVRSVRDEAACGLPGRVGRRYGLRLYRRKGRPHWSSDLCSLMSPRDMRLAASTGGAPPGHSQAGTPPCS